MLNSRFYTCIYIYFDCDYYNTWRAITYLCVAMENAKYCALHWYHCYYRITFLMLFFLARKYCIICVCTGWFLFFSEKKTLASRVSKWEWVPNAHSFIWSIVNLYTNYPNWVVKKVIPFELICKIHNYFQVVQNIAYKIAQFNSESQSDIIIMIKLILYYFYFEILERI